MSSHAEQHLVYRVSNAQLSVYPYPHFLAHDVFPRDYYARMLENLLPETLMRPIKDERPVGPAYSDRRFVLPLTPEHVARLPAENARFWTEFATWFLGGRFANALMNKFGPFLEQRFKTESGQYGFFNEAMLVDDRTRYSLGPHSDSPAKVITLLFYLPADDSRAHLGTSIYVPKDPAFRCAGGPHHPFERFERVVTMPFVPNTLFAFFKTDNSFHGVEPIADEDCRRHLLFYDVKCAPARAKPAPPPPAAAPKANFTF